MDASWMAPKFKKWLIDRFLLQLVLVRRMEDSSYCTLYDNVNDFSYAFNWKATPEGHVFWNSVYNDHVRRNK